MAATQLTRNAMRAALPARSYAELLALFPYTGSATFTGNSGSIASTTHGFTTPLYVVASVNATSAPGADGFTVSYGISGSNVTIYVWKVTSGTDATPTAATSSCTVNYAIYGTI